MIRALLLAGLGGGIGSMLRYLTSVVVAKYVQGVFPLAIFIVNIGGCFLIGVFMGLMEGRQCVNPDLRFLFITGFCGGYTTFSTFAAENVGLVQAGHLPTAILYVVASVAVGMGAVWLGLMLGKP
jgi:CrcB protein